MRTNLDQARTYLSELLGVAVALGRPQPPSVRDHLITLTDLDTRDGTMRLLLIEGGNPIGAETRMLIEALHQVALARKGYDRAAADRWRVVAAALVPMVQADLLELLRLAAGGREPERELQL